MNPEPHASSTTCGKKKQANLLPASCPWRIIDLNLTHAGSLYVCMDRSKNKLPARDAPEPHASSTICGKRKQATLLPASCPWRSLLRNQPLREVCKHVWIDLQINFPQGLIMSHAARLQLAGRKKLPSVLNRGFDPRDWVSRKKTTSREDYQ
jgi:hypothetical protein